MKGENLAWLAVLFLFCVGYSHQKYSRAPTPLSRLDLLHAMFVHRTVRIDAYHTNTPDKAVFNGSYFSDKAPGTVALAMVPFGVAATTLSRAGIDLDSKAGWLFSSWMACAGSIGIITALGGLALFAWLSKHVRSRWALITSLVVVLGAAPLPYSTMMFSHALVVGLLAIAIWAMTKQSEADPLSQNPAVLLTHPSRQAGRSAGKERRSWFSANRWDLLAGFACGWALASEYSAGLVIVGLFLWLLSMNRDLVSQRDAALPANGGEGKREKPIRSGERVPPRWKRAIPFCLAAIPPLLLIPAYSWACFGDPFTLPYSHQASFPQMKEGVYGIKWPDAETAFNLLFRPARGLFFWTPFFVMAGFGYWQLMRKSHRLFWLTYAVPLLHVVVISGRVWDWPAGPAWGPRLLSPMVPFLALPCALGLQKFPRLGIVLGAYSVLITTLATLTDACPSFNEHPNPLFDLNIPLFLKGEFSPNLGMMLGLPPYVSIAFFYAMLIGGTCWLWWQCDKVVRVQGLSETGKRRFS